MDNFPLSRRFRAYQLKMLAAHLFLIIFYDQYGLQPTFLIMALNFLFYHFRRPVLPIRQNWKVSPSTHMVVFTGYMLKIWIWVTNSSQCGLPCRMFLSQTIGRRWICLFCVPFNILQIYTNLLHLSHSFC